MPERRDPYAILGLQRTATQAEVKAAFRRLAREHHPDANPQDLGAERRFKRVARAYETLSHPSSRRAYDERFTRGRFGSPGGDRSASFPVDRGPIYHSDLGHHSDFYQVGDPLTVAEAAAAVGRDAGWLRRAIREGRLVATREASGYLLRRRDVERLDRTAPRRRHPTADDEVLAGDEPARERRPDAEA